MRNLLTVLKWFFLTLGVGLLVLGAAVSRFNLRIGQVEQVSAALDPATPPWEEFDPYAVGVSNYSAPTTTNLPDRTEGSAARAVPVPFGPEEVRGLPPERIVIPSIELDAPVEPTGAKLYKIGDKVYEQWIVPDKFAAGWSPHSSYPGFLGNTVLFGHHNVNGAVFANLYKLQSGDEISVFAGGREYKYRVNDVLKLKEQGVSLDKMLENASWINPTEDERLTLVTCWPPYQSTYRLIIVAKPAPVEP